MPDHEIVRITELGHELRANAAKVVSRQAGLRFAGYLRTQRQRMLDGAIKVNRPELIEKYGFDTKYAMHMVRLGVQGVELLETGRMTLPIAEPWLTWLRDLRRGKHMQDEALAAAAELEDRLERLVRVLHPCRTSRTATGPTAGSCGPTARPGKRRRDVVSGKPVSHSRQPAHPLEPSPPRRLDLGRRRVRVRRFRGVPQHRQVTVHRGQW